MVWVPPGGFAGLAQQAPAVRNKVARAARGKSGTTKRRRKKKAVGATRKRKMSRTRPRKKGKLKKGSAAAKAYMAKIRRKRK